MGRYTEALQVALDAALEDGGELPVGLREHLARILPELKLIRACLIPTPLGTSLSMCAGVRYHAIDRHNLGVVRRQLRGWTAQFCFEPYNTVDRSFMTWVEAHAWMVSEFKWQGFVVGMDPDVERELALSDLPLGRS